MPTLCEIIGVDLPNDLDGSNFMPLLEDKPFLRNHPLYWFFYRTLPEIAMRVGDYMILGLNNDTISRPYQFSQEDYECLKTILIKDYELFDLSKDFSQENNIFDLRPKKDSIKKMINNQLEKIRKRLYTWKNLSLK